VGVALEATATTSVGAVVELRVGGVEGTETAKLTEGTLAHTGAVVVRTGLLVASGTGSTH
jgi:hypothetical protein